MCIPQAISQSKKSMTAIPELDSMILFTYSFYLSTNSIAPIAYIRMYKKL